DIAGLKAHKDPAALAQAREQLEKNGKPFREADVLQRAYDNAMRQYGTGSDLQKAAQAVTGALRHTWRRKSRSGSVKTIFLGATSSDKLSSVNGPTP
ncbi:hypothetical protein ACRFNC_22885, partial [Serratia marcescens]